MDEDKRGSFRSVGHNNPSSKGQPTAQHTETWPVAGSLGGTERGPEMARYGVVVLACRCPQYLSIRCFIIFPPRAGCRTLFILLCRLLAGPMDSKSVVLSNNLEVQDQA
jgi:hypothetical protein